MIDNESTEDSTPDVAREGEPEFEPEQADLYRRALHALNDAGVPYLIAGAMAKHAYTGIWRDTKDLDIFLRPEDLEASLTALANAGLEITIEFRHWLAKALQEPYFIDLIFGTGHGQLQIDDSWFENSRPIEIAGVKTQLIPPEELLVSKAFVAERYRFDGADVLHLIQGTKGQIDWQRVLELLGDNRGLLLPYLLLFAFVYPGRTAYLPQSLMVKLFEEARQEWSEPHGRKVSRGTLLDPFSYTVDVEDWGYQDQRNLEPLVNKKGELKS
ncbi:MAG TPA: nucleotidyltransferase [Anaerolineae bacterium]